MTRSLIKIFSCLLFLSGCVNTYVEEKASLEFEPIYPTQEFDQPNRNVNGSIYAQAGGGLFATDRRAQTIGDILTVNLSEQFSAKKAQGATYLRKRRQNLGPMLKNFTKDSPLEL